MLLYNIPNSLLHPQLKTLSFFLNLMDVKSSSFPSFRNAFSYHVFLSFRGSDTRYSFTGNLYKELCDKGIHTFFDDGELQSGEEITPALLKAIEESRIAIVILSENYASSSFCLDELVHIVQFVEAKGRLVLPVFYDVDPSHVRHQKESYGKAMAEHEARYDMKRIQKWKKALNQVANLSGYHFKHGDGYEHMFISKIVEHVSRKINRVPLHVADYTIGLESKVLEVKSLLNVASDNNVNMVGIHGIGGIGKTTLALAVYNFIADHFDGSCFLENVREKSCIIGLIPLQKIVFSKILGENIELASVGEGIALMQSRLQTKKVLLILDDVDNSKQLQAFLGRPNWFGPGSTIIITTRDKQLLQCHGIEKTYEVKELNKKDAIELLRRKAFGSIDNVCRSYCDMLDDVATYACGLPLALRVIGSNLFGKSVEQWKGALDQYRRIPIKEIRSILKVSFDALEEEEQRVFLDIACFFKGDFIEEVKYILFAHYGYCVTYQISVLVDKSLIKINGNGVLSLHDLIEEMGKEIVRQESRSEVGERSRLWFSKDIVQVLEKNLGTCKIEIIILKNFFQKEEEEIEWNGEAFKKMTKLKTLIIRKGHFSSCPKHLPNSLRVLEWWRYPSHNLPSDFHPKDLVMLKLPDNRFTSSVLINKSKKFVNMKVLNLGDCQHLTHIGDVSGLSNLEELTFSGCENLITIHSSVGLLDELKILNASFCKSLTSFPPMKLTSLERLNFQYCSNLEAFPEIIGTMENIKYLVCWECKSLKEIPSSIVNLTGLFRIQLSSQYGLEPPSRFGRLHKNKLPKLTFFEASYTIKLPKQAEGGKKWIEILHLRSWQLSEISLSSLPICFPNVKELDLSGSDFAIIPECFKGYHSLRTLIVDDCKSLQEIRGIPPKLEKFSAIQCHSLSSLSRNMFLNQNKLPEQAEVGKNWIEILRLCSCKLSEISLSSLPMCFANVKELDLSDSDFAIIPECFKGYDSLRTLIVDDCKSLWEIKGIPPKLEKFSAIQCHCLSSSSRIMLLNQELHETRNSEFCLPGVSIPNWFEHKSFGYSKTFWWRNESVSLVLGFAFQPFDHRKTMTIKVWSNGHLVCHYFSATTGKDHIYLLNLEHKIVFKNHSDEWNYAILEVKSEYDIKEMGIHVTKPEDIQFRNPYKKKKLDDGIVEV